MVKRQGVVETAAVAKNLGQGVVGTGMTRIKLDRTFRSGGSLIQSAEAPTSIGEAELGIGRRRLEASRATKCREGFLGLARGQCHHTQIDERFGVSGIGRNRPPKKLHRFVQPAASAFNQSEMRHGLGIVGRQGQGSGNGFGRLVLTPGLMRRHAEKVPSGCVVGSLGQDRATKALGLGGAAGALVFQCARHAGIFCHNERGYRQCSILG